MNIYIKGIILCLMITVTITAICLSVPTNQTEAESSSSDLLKPKYILSDFEGNLAIYEGNNKAPLEILDVKTDSLPERDIERIKMGIYADSLSEIISLAEDYE